jgi:hypothetical protein
MRRRIANVVIISIERLKKIAEEWNENARYCY